jgi:hypothetical protein
VLHFHDDEAFVSYCSAIVAFSQPVRAFTLTASLDQLTVNDAFSSANLHRTALPAKPNPEGFRSATRFRQEAKTAFAILHQSVGDNLRVEIHDESLFGICLVMPDTRGLAVGDELDLTYASTAMQATVKHVTPYKDDFYLVGLSTRPVIDDDAIPEA